MKSLTKILFAFFFFGVPTASSAEELLKNADLAYGVILLLVIIASISSARLVNLNRESLFFDSIAQLAPSRLLLVYFLPACVLILCLYFDVHEYTNGFTVRGEEEVAELFGAIGLFAYSISKVSLLLRLSRSY